MKPNFRHPLARPIDNFHTRESFTLIAASQLAPTREKIGRIVAICNQPQIYQMLFIERCQGAPYSEVEAQSFLDWSFQGGQEQTHFVFMIGDSQDAVYHRFEQYMHI